MPACESHLPALIDAASGELTAVSRRELDQHLATCEGCRAELADLVRTEQVLRSTSNVPDDFMLTGFPVRVTDRAETFRDRSTRGLWWSLTRAMRVTLAFSTTAVAASFALFVMSQRVPMAPSTPSHGVAVQGQTAAAATPTVASLVGTDPGEWPVEPTHVAAEDHQAAVDDQGVLDVSLDSALDALSPDELDELAGQLQEG
jgi:anti-sigma factor RsiW